MSYQKYDYYLSLNNVNKTGNLFYSFGQTRNISLFINSKGASICFQTGKNYLVNLDQPYFFNLIKEGIKRTALLHILQYQKPLNINNVLLTVSKSGKIIGSTDLTDSLIFYQLFDHKINRPINTEWKKYEIQQNILKYKKSGGYLSDSISALYAYLFSKTKNKETERFAYLWIAMNGFFVASTSENKDRNAMNAFIKKFNLGKTVLTQKEREKVCASAIFELMKIPEPVTKYNLGDDDHKTFSNYIQGKMREYDKNEFETTPYGFLLTDLPYYLRCKLLHAEHPIELFSFESDWELKSLRIVNNLIEDFLDNNLHLLFSQYS